MPAPQWTESAIQSDPPPVSCASRYEHSWADAPDTAVRRKIEIHRSSHCCGGRSDRPWCRSAHLVGTRMEQCRRSRDAVRRRYRALDPCLVCRTRWRNLDRSRHPGKRLVRRRSGRPHGLILCPRTIGRIRRSDHSRPRSPPANPRPTTREIRLSRLVDRRPIRHISVCRNTHGFTILQRASGRTIEEREDSPRRGALRSAHVSRHHRTSSHVARPHPASSNLMRRRHFHCAPRYRALRVDLPRQRSGRRRPASGEKESRS